MMAMNTPHEDPQKRSRSWYCTCTLRTPHLLSSPHIYLMETQLLGTELLSPGFTLSLPVFPQAHAVIAFAQLVSKA